MSIKLMKKFIKEELIRGMPDYVMEEAAEEACSYLKKGLMKSIQQRSLSGTEKRIQIAFLNKRLRTLKDELHEEIKSAVDDIIHNL